MQPHHSCQARVATVVAIRYNPDIKAQYERLTSKGKSKMSVLGAAMRKLVQICLFWCSKTPATPSTTNDCVSLAIEVERWYLAVRVPYISALKGGDVRRN
jgi:hypothetical protein